MGEVKDIPFRRGVSSQIFDVELDGEAYALRLDEAPRYDGYRLGIYEPDGTPLLLNQRLAYGVECFPRNTNAAGDNLPVGFFYLIDARAAAALDPRIGDLGDLCVLQYNSEAIEAAAAGTLPVTGNPASDYITSIVEDS